MTGGRGAAGDRRWGTGTRSRGGVCCEESMMRSNQGGKGSKEVTSLGSLNEY